jgi:SAM-dependent methyltransferase
MTRSTATANAERQIAYLDEAAASDAGREYKQHVLREMRTLPGHVVLDVGYPYVEIQAGDAHAVPLEPASVDRARADRVLQHLADPATAVAELRRVLRPGGRVALAEPDWDTLAIDAPHIATSRAYTRFVTTNVVRNAAIGRSLGRLLHNAGLIIEAVNATVAVFRDYRSAEAILRMPAVAERAWQAGHLDEDTTRAWLTELATGPFLAAVTFFTATGRLPEDRPAQRGSGKDSDC